MHEWFRRRLFRSAHPSSTVHYVTRYGECSRLRVQTNTTAITSARLWNLLAIVFGEVQLNLSDIPQYNSAGHEIREQSRQYALCPDSPSRRPSALSRIPREDRIDAKQTFYSCLRSFASCDRTQQWCTYPKRGSWRRRRSWHSIPCVSSKKTITNSSYKFSVTWNTTWDCLSFTAYLVMTASQYSQHYHFYECSQNIQRPCDWYGNKPRYDST